MRSTHEEGMPEPGMPVQQPQTVISTITVPVFPDANSSTVASGTVASGGEVGVLSRAENAYPALEEKLSSVNATSGKQYWRSLEELADTKEFEDYLHREFPEQASEWYDPVSRRNFMKVMGASFALMGLNACTRQPRE